MAGEQQLHQLNIEQFVTAQDAQIEAQNGANQKFQDQLHGLAELQQGRPIRAITAAPTLESDKFSRADERKSLLEEVTKEPIDTTSIIESLHRNWPRKLTPEDRTKAKDVLGKDISPLITDADSKTLKSMQEAIVDGNIGKLAETLKNMPPERAKAFIKELNKELKDHHAGIELSATGDGRVFVYEKSGQTAIQVNRDGTTQLKPIRQNYDGSIVVEPGEIINKDAEGVMKGISDAAVRGITGGDRIIWHEKPEYPKNPPPFFPKPRVDFPPIEWPKDRPDLGEPPIFKPLPWRETKPNTNTSDPYELLKRPFWINKANRGTIQY